MYLGKSRFLANLAFTISGTGQFPMDSMDDLAILPLQTDS